MEGLTPPGWFKPPGGGIGSARALPTGGTRSVNQKAESIKLSADRLLGDVGYLGLQKYLRDGFNKKKIWEEGS